MSSEAIIMAKKNGGNALALQGFEQTTLRVLLGLREQVNASQAAANGGVRNYLIQLLTSRGLDPQKWGVSPDMTAFVEIQQPPAQAPPPPPANVAPGQQTFAESAPAAAPESESPAPEAS
jgi:hypothetical protein